MPKVITLFHSLRQITKRYFTDRKPHRNQRITSPRRVPVQFNYHDQVGKGGKMAIG